MITATFTYYDVVRQTRSAGKLLCTLHACKPLRLCNFLVVGGLHS